MRGFAGGETFSATPDIRHLRAPGVNFVPSPDQDVLGAHERALSFLSFRPRSTAEVRHNLLRHGVARETVDEVVTRLEATGLLGDEAFANYWVRSRQHFSPRGRRALRQELFQKGVERDTIDTVLDELDVDESVSATEAARKRIRGRHAVLDERSEQRLISFLRRRGFTYEASKSALQAIKDETTLETNDNQETE